MGIFKAAGRALGLVKEKPLSITPDFSRWDALTDKITDFSDLSKPEQVPEGTRLAIQQMERDKGRTMGDIAAGGQARTVASLDAAAATGGYDTGMRERALRENMRNTTAAQLEAGGQLESDITQARANALLQERSAKMTGLLNVLPSMEKARQQTTLQAQLGNMGAAQQQRAGDKALLGSLGGIAGMAVGNAILPGVGGMMMGGALGKGIFSA